MFAITVALLLIFSFSGELLAQELYRWVDDKEIIHFSDNLHSIPEKYRRGAEKRLFAASMEMPTPAPQNESERSNEPAPLQPGVPFFRQGNQITVDGFINQNVAVSFIVDPGVLMTTLPRSIGSHLGIKPDKSIPFNLEGIRGVTSGRLITVDSLRLGDVEMNDVEIVIREYGSSGMGLLGTDLLGRFNVHIDDGSKRIELTPKDELYDGRAPEWWQEKFRFYRGLKQTYEKHIKQGNESFNKLQQLGLFEYGGDFVAALEQIRNEIKTYQGYVRLVTQKIDDLDRRAGYAAVPRELRE